MNNNLVRENNGQATIARRENERFITPPASVSETADGYLLELEMSGVSKDGLEISIENNELSIIGRRSNPAVEGTLIHRESRPNDYRRVFEIDPSIDREKISARINQGIVSLTLPKAEEVKPRKIAVS
ncbi:MAG TPA: Hsp20/alpha crystallin family protein [Chthoniobacterales bacterium]|jgi:HSP20 family protein